MSDIRAQQAREHQRALLEARRLEEFHLQQRDRLILLLRSDDPARWTYAALAKAVGISPEAIAKIVQTDLNRRAGSSSRGGRRASS